MGSRTSFLRYRLMASGLGLGLLLLGAVPWTILVVARQGDIHPLTTLFLVGWGLVFLPFLWLGWKVLRMSWRPVQAITPWGGVWRARTQNRAQKRPAERPRDDVLEAEWREK